MAGFLPALLDRPRRRARAAATRRRRRPYPRCQRRRTMTDVASRDEHGVRIAPDAIEIKRLLPGPIERVWAYLTESDLRRRWLAAGEMGLQAGMPFELTWRNDELTDPPGPRPEGFSEEHK